VSRQRVALITGANKGIGYATAAELSDRGLHVLVGARDVQRGRQAVERLSISARSMCVVPIDVTDDVSVDKAMAAIADEYGRLDVLINNAGVLLDQDTPVLDVDPDQLRKTFDVNIFGAARVSRAAVPLLKAGERARIVNLSSSLGSLTVNSRDYERMAPYQRLAYGSSKAALNALTIFYANALRDARIAVNSVEPGYVATDLNCHTGPGRVEDAARVVAAVALDDDQDRTGEFVSAAGVVQW
jgi:NAD(P)-dependent dehydrogenase (short-subunit alcohol dehydrogenase family)